MPFFIILVSMKIGGCFEFGEEMDSMELGFFYFPKTIKKKQSGIVTLSLLKG